MQKGRIYGLQQEGERWQLRTGDVKIKRIRTFKYVRMLLTDDAKCSTETRRRIIILKNAFQNQNQVLRIGRYRLETSKRLLNRYMISIILY